MKFDVILGNPIITKQEDGKFTVIHTEPSSWHITKHENLTYEEVVALPFVDESILKLL